MKYLTALTLGLAFALLVSASLVSRPVFAYNLFPCDNATAGSATCQNNAQQQQQTRQSNKIYGANGILTKVVNLYGIATGVVSVIMIIIGGFKFATASGDPNNVKSAKNTVLFALVGLVIAAIAVSIVQFVLKRL